MLILPQVDGEWKREGPLVLMVAADSARLYTINETPVSAQSDHSEIAKLKKGQNGIFSNVKAAIKHGLRPTAEIVAEVSPQIIFCKGVSYSLTLT